MAKDNENDKEVKKREGAEWDVYSTKAGDLMTFTEMRMFLDVCRKHYIVFPANI